MLEGSFDYMEKKHNSAINNCENILSVFEKMGSIAKIIIPFLVKLENSQ